ncbi:MAG TPA: DNA polymerase III subunit gamma/tau, partial [Candidatus Cloacimonadota bacterium]|nr:DNA polymerase III subunit gamma/tau [Candidatus Cloacimonadota bacterium]
MSYIVLARKYRPQNFSEVYAQDHVTKILQSAIASGRIAQAYLFTGPRGVGKTSLARIMAKSLNCLEGPTTTPCNKCTNCVEITAGISPDVIEIDGASNTGVDDIRELQRELLYAASGAKYKIYIIDEVHMLSKSAFNALLKTLEEPPENVIFIFATTEPHKVLPTIISRCQRYDFKRIPVDAIVQRLKDLAVQEDIRVDEESLYLIARKADGGMRDALSLMDQTISYCMNDINIERVRQIFGMIPNQVYHDFMQLIHAHDPGSLIEMLHQIFEEGTDLQEFIANMLEYLRIVILRKLGIAINDVSQDELPLFEEIASIFSQTDLLYVMSQLMQTRADIRLSGNPYLLIEATMIKLARLEEIS